MANIIKIKRTTAAQLATAVGSSSLNQGEPYLITDTNQMAIGLSTTTYTLFQSISGTLTAGSVVFAGTGGVLTQDNANLFWDDTNNRLGIGETVPDYKLDVNGTVGFTPGSSVTPVDNGDVVFELTSNTALTIKAKGSDATVRSFEVPLASTAEKPITQGVHSIPIPAQALAPNITNGPAPVTTETTTNKVMVKTLDFDAATQESAQIQVAMPKNWNEGTVTVEFCWTATSTGNVVWGCSGIALSDDDVLDTAFGTGQTVTDGVTAANDVMWSAATSAITIAGSPAAKDIVWFKFYRDASNGSDTCTVDAKLIAVRLLITFDAGNEV